MSEQPMTDAEFQAACDRIYEWVCNPDPAQRAEIVALQQRSYEYMCAHPEGRMQTIEEDQ